MTGARWLNAGLAAAWLVFAGFALWTLPDVPFHPDESTYLYMSRDFDLLFRQANPAAVTWRADNQPKDVFTQRLLDAPLAYYLPGLGRLLAGEASALPHDWNWSLDWAANAASGAVPTAGLLTAGRWPAAVMTVLSLLPLYGIGLRLGGQGTAVAAVVLYALSGLVLLHGRRAMSEGPLLFFTLAAVWLVLYRPRATWLWAGAAALAVASKLSALAVLPVLGLALVWPQAGKTSAASRWSWRGWTTRARLQRMAICAIVFIGLYWLLTPALWSEPQGGVAAMLAARRELLSDQTNALSQANPGQVSSSVGPRLFSILYQVYFAPPAFWDVSNYAQQTAASELRYLSNPLQVGWHTPVLSTNLVEGGVVLALTLAGLFFGLHDLAAQVRPAAHALSADQRFALSVMLVWSVATVAGLLLINIAWQRYDLPLVPIVCLWAAYGLVMIFRPFVVAVQQRRAQG